MLKNCVLLGLDWVKPIMQLFLHITCSCTFHSFVPYFSLSLVLCCDDAFLFVSLSFSLSDRLRMASKRNTTLSRNSLHFETSSSNPTPLHVQFYDEKARPDFSENFSKRGIHSEHHVILLNFFDTTLPTVIHSKGWESLCEIPVNCPTMIIQEFYSNMHDFNTFIPWFVTQV